jgi:hypothetical protein
MEDASVIAENMVVIDRKCDVNWLSEEVMVVA